MESSPRDDTIAEIVSEFSQLFAVARSRWAKFAEEVHPELRGPGMIILQTILRRGPVTATGISGLLGMDKAFVSRQVTKLRTLGLIDAVEAENDRRVTLLTASEAAQHAVEELQRRSGEDYRVQFTEWSTEDLTQLQVLLHRYNTNSQDANFDGPAQRCAKHAEG